MAGAARTSKKRCKRSYPVGSLTVTPLSPRLQNRNAAPAMAGFSSLSSVMRVGGDMRERRRELANSDENGRSVTEIRMTTRKSHRWSELAIFKLPLAETGCPATIPAPTHGHTWLIGGIVFFALVCMLQL